MDITYERALELAYFTFVTYVDYHEWVKTHSRRVDDAERARRELCDAKNKERMLGQCELIAAMFAEGNRYGAYDVYCDLKEMWDNDDARRA